MDDVNTARPLRATDHDQKPTLTGDIVAGGISSLLSVVYGLSFAALIFSGPLEPYLGYGVAASFVAIATGALVVAFRSSVPFAIGGTDSATAAITASFAAATVTPLVASGASDLLTPILFALTVSAALTGLALVFLGGVRAGIAIRFVPYPVIAGFLGATGWLMAIGAIRVIIGEQPTLANLADLLTSQHIVTLIAGCLVAGLLFFGQRLFHSSLALPVVLLGAMALTYIVLGVTGTDIAEARRLGWLFQKPEQVEVSLPVATHSLGDLPWSAIPVFSGDLFAVVFVTVITVLLNTTGIELITKREANVERELTTVGMGNLLSAAFGGYVTCVSLSRTAMSYEAGGRGRLGGYLVAALAAFVLLVGSGFIGLIPKFIAGGLLIYLGANLLVTWLVASAWRVSKLEYASLLAITLIILIWGFVAGVLIGIVIGCATFAMSAARVSATRFRFDGSEFRSSLERSHKELAVLAKHGDEIQGMCLQSYLFFGSAHGLYRQVKRVLAEHPNCHFMLFDFRPVTGIDSSAIHSFVQIKQAVAEAEATLILTNLKPNMMNLFKAQGIIDHSVVVTSDFDRALEDCERRVIERYLPRGPGPEEFQTWLAGDLGSPELADELIAACTKHTFNAGEIIARQGEPADSMHFIVEGRVAIVVQMPEGKDVRVGSLGRHTTIGEMGMVADQSRSATMLAETDCIAYRLTRETYAEISNDNPRLAHALLTYVFKVVAERLNFASRTMGLLRR